MRVFLKEKEGKNGKNYLEGYARMYGRSVKVYVFKASGEGVDAVANVIVKQTMGYRRPMGSFATRRRYVSNYRRRSTM